MTASASEIVSFWRKAGPDRWFVKDATFDNDIVDRFLGAHEAAVAGRLSEWEQTAQGTLALLILLDQFPRNMFRGEARIGPGHNVREATHAAIDAGASAPFANCHLITNPGDRGFHRPPRATKCRSRRCRNRRRRRKLKGARSGRLGDRGNYGIAHEVCSHRRHRRSGPLPHSRSADGEL